jgi:hypothetical protein
LAAIILGRPLSLLWQRFFMFGRVASPTLIDITVVHIAVYLLILVLLGENRLRALISASFAFSIINITHLPVMYLILLIASPFIGSSSYIDFLQQYPQIYYCIIFFSNIVITLSCLFAARFLRKTKLKPSIKIYVCFNVLFVLFPLVILVLYEDILSVMSISLLSSAVILTFFFVLILFLFFLYTRLTSDNLTTFVKKTDSPLPATASEVVEYAPFIQYLSKRNWKLSKRYLPETLVIKKPHLPLMFQSTR